MNDFQSRWDIHVELEDLNAGSNHHEELGGGESVRLLKQWSHVQLNSVCSKIGSGATPRGGESVYVEEGTAIIRSQNVYNGLFTTDGLAHLTEEHAEQLKGVTVEPRDVLLNITGDSVARCCLVPDWVLPARVNQHVSIMRPDSDQLLPEFLCYYFVSPLMQKYLLSRGGSGGTRNALTKGMIAAFEVPCPPLVTQQRIVDLLKNYDDLIENNRRRIQLLEQAARLLYREWFVYLRFPGHEHVSSTDGVPEGWRRVPLQEVCKRITDGSHSSPRSIDEGFPMASVKDMHDWGFNIDQCRKISHQDFDLLVKNDCKPLKNDVLIAKDGSYLKHTFVVQEEIDFVILSSIAILRPNHLIDPHLLNFILRDPRTKMRMTGYVSGVALPRIILKEFRGFEILLPPVELQLLWAIHANPIAVQCYQLGKQNETLTKARDLLLPRLMNGEVAV